MGRSFWWERDAQAAEQSGGGGQRVGFGGLFEVWRNQRAGPARLQLGSSWEATTRPVGGRATGST